MPLSGREQEPFRHGYLIWGLTSKEGIYVIRNIDLKVNFPIPLIFVRRKAEHEEFKDLEQDLYVVLMFHFCLTHDTW